MIDATVIQAKENAELKDKLFVSEVLLKKLYVQNQELAEKLSKANVKTQQVELDYRTLQKQHLLLQHNVQSKIIGICELNNFIATRVSQMSQRTLGFHNSARRNSFDKFIETQGIRDEVSSFWSDLRQSTNNYMNTESVDEDLARRINNVFESQNIKTKSRAEYDDLEVIKENN
jgi:hypothetical protein